MPSPGRALGSRFLLCVLAPEVGSFHQVRLSRRCCVRMNRFFFFFCTNTHTTTQSAHTSSYSTHAVHAHARIHLDCAHTRYAQLVVLKAVEARRAEGGQRSGSRRFAFLRRPLVAPLTGDNPRHLRDRPLHPPTGPERSGLQAHKDGTGGW